MKNYRKFQIGCKSPTRDVLLERDDLITTDLPNYLEIERSKSSLTVTITAQDDLEGLTVTTEENAGNVTVNPRQPEKRALQAGETTTVRFTFSNVSIVGNLLNSRLSFTATVGEDTVVQYLDLYGKVVPAVNLEYKADENSYWMSAELELGYTESPVWSFVVTNPSQTTPVENIFASFSPDWESIGSVETLGILMGKSTLQPGESTTLTIHPPLGLTDGDYSVNLYLNWGNGSRTYMDWIEFIVSGDYEILISVSETVGGPQLAGSEFRFMDPVPGYPYDYSWTQENEPKVLNLPSGTYRIIQTSCIED